MVNNYVGTGGLDADVYCTLAPTPELKQGLAAFCNVRLPREVMQPRALHRSIDRTDHHATQRDKQQALQPEFIAKVCPAVFGCVGFGAAMYELGPTPSNTSGFGLRRLWGRDDVSCGTSIPLIAEGQAGEQGSTTYCVGACVTRGGPTQTRP